MHPMFFVLAFTFHCLALQAPGQAKRNGFTVDLIHRDSLHLPHNNHFISSSELLRKAALRSFSQANHYTSSMNFDSKLIESVMIRNGADYLMRISLGYSYEVLALASTGSELLWINCDPSDTNYDQEKDPFNTTKSTTYDKLSFNDKLCQGLKKKRRAGKKKDECEYKYSYEKEGYTIGILSRESFYLDPKDENPHKIVFGCSHESRFNFEGVVQGVIGLGGGDLSLVTQLKDEIDNKFSYCLVRNSAITNSKLKFGYQVESSVNRVSTLFSFKPSYPFYYLNLRRISIAKEEMWIFPHFGDIIIDSGIAMTLLHSTIYDRLEEIIIQKVGLEPTRDPEGTFKMCFETKRLSTPKVKSILPKLIFHFDGADVSLRRRNVYIKYYDYTCLAIAPYDGISVFGNTAQKDFQVDYDLKETTVSFTSRNCSEF